MRNRNFLYLLSLSLLIFFTATGCQEQNGADLYSGEPANVYPAMPVMVTPALLPPIVTTNEFTVTATVEHPARATPTRTPIVTTTSPPSATIEAVVESTAHPSPTSEPAAVEAIGASAQGRPILVYHFGSGDTDVIFVGGMHGGYEWNTSMLAYQFIDFYQDNPLEIPASFTLHIIPNANPDGLYAVTGKDGPFELADVSAYTIPGRFNANGVDLNRNWDCLWSPTGVWRDLTVSGGSSPFSEPETAALRDYFLRNDPAAIVFWHSADKAVYAAGCPEPHQPSYNLARVYGDAAGYPVFPIFDNYNITGDASDWLSTQNIPSFSVELTTHETLDWEQNMAGIVALWRYLEGSLAPGNE